MNNYKENKENIKKNTIWIKVLYFVFFIIIAVICYNIYMYFFDDNNTKIKISDVTDNIIYDVTDIELPNIGIDVPDVDVDLVEINSIIDDMDMVPNDITFTLLKQENISHLNKINELFDSFE
jgi:hypothetical protein